MADTGDMITIPLKVYNELMSDSRILGALYAGGVDNWEWYDEALKDLRADEDDDDD